MNGHIFRILDADAVGHYNFNAFHDVVDDYIKAPE